MKKIIGFSSILLSITAEAATIKSINGKTVSIKLTEAELVSIESDSSYEIMNAGNKIGRVKIKRIFPGKGVSGTLESQTPEIKTAEKITLNPIAIKQKEPEKSLHEEGDMEDESEDKAIKPGSGHPEVIREKIGVDFNLILGTHKLESKDDEDSSSAYASNLSFRAVYKFSSIPLGIGGHIKNNNITKKYNEDGIKSELSFDLNALGLTLMTSQDFGSFRPYALLEISSGEAKVKVKSESIFGNFESESEPQDYTQNAIILGGAWLIGNFSIGGEYQVFGDMVIDAPKNSDSNVRSKSTNKSTGFSINLGYSI